MKSDIRCDDEDFKHNIFESVKRKLLGSGQRDNTDVLADQETVGAGD